ncbi:MAG: hypothetical protein N2482_03575, partial [Patescibacteria group bacterium]|nr:hypothetical protein [Patescibacteria group bacterium]
MKIKNLKLKILVFFYFFFYFLFFINKPVVANDFQINYWVEYFLNKSNNDFKTKVKYQIKITNLRSDVYVDKFFLSFPKDFLVEQVLAKDDRGEIKPEISLEERYLKIALEFSQPNIGKNSQNNLFLEFNQDNLFRVNGKIWEVFLPTLEKKESSHYQAIINLPLDTDKKLTIAKPLPTRITGNQ